MASFKAGYPDDEDVFVVTPAYRKLYERFKSLKTQKGRFIHVIGSPGTGKSTNIYHALRNLDLNVCEVTLLMDGANKSSREVFKEIFHSLENDLNLKTKEKVYEKSREFDAVLFGDRFLDSEFWDDSKVGLSLWMDHQGIKALSFYLLCIVEYLKHKRDLNKINIILHHSMIVRIKGVKYDLFTDWGLFSRIMTGILKLFFEVVEVSYSEPETMKIVKTHFPDADEEQIRLYIREYGYKPRFISKALENVIME